MSNETRPLGETTMPTPALRRRPALSARSPVRLLLGALILTSVSGLYLPVRAGTLDARFAERLERQAPGEMAGGLIFLRDQVDLGAIEQELAVRGPVSRWRRHQTVVSAAQALAARSQGALLRELESARARGEAGSVRSFWVTNLIAVEGSPALFRRLAARADVGVIYEDGPIDLRLGWDDGGPIPAGGPRILPNNLICVNVEPVWNLGFHGEGRLVCVLDTGADGEHEALGSRWRGAQPGVHWSWAWKDPATGTEFPYDWGQHGTHVTGIILGEKPDGTPIGVAPGAQWIAGGLLIQYTVQNALACYEWALDPDGDPGTFSDVPDVINNSWGTSGDCDPTYWNAIDLVEAAGIVNVVSVDNSGPAPASVNSPESRAASSTTNFGVGNVNPHLPDYPIASTSGRGPSPCDYASIKPEVTAPGTQIYSTKPHDTYGNLTGTSMACPHVAGALLLLRQIDPDLPVEEAKTVLMETALDRGGIGEDNDYGWGIIDIAAAADRVRAALPNLPPAWLYALVDGDDVSLSWAPPVRLYPANPLLAYRVYRAPVGEPFPAEPLAEISSLFAITFFLDSNVPPGSYHYVVTARYGSGESGPTTEVNVTIQGSSSVDGPRALEAARLLAAPNPLIESTVIRYRIDGTGPIRLTIHDAAGARVRALTADDGGSAGFGSVPWDGCDDGGRRLPRGTYFVRSQQGDRVDSRSVSIGR